MVVCKKIHQIWFQGQNYPDRYKENVRKLKEIYNDCEYKLWTEKEMVKLLREKYQWFIPIYNAYEQMIQKIDAMKYFILYDEGGYYFDMDMNPLRSVHKEVEGYDLALVTFGTRSERFIIKLLFEEFTYNNGWFYAKPKNEFFRIAIYSLPEAYVKHSKHYTLHKRIFCTTGPAFITKCAKTYLEIPDTKVKIFSQKLIEPRESHEISPDAYSIHSFDSLWFDQSVLSSPSKSFFGLSEEKRLMVYFSLIIFIIVIIATIIVVIKRVLNKRQMSKV